MYKSDDRIVITLDAGGTNFVFGAMQGCEFITQPIRKHSNSDNLDACLQTMVDGFSEVIGSLDKAPVAISFAFPGPADYPGGIIGGNLPNFPSFRDGVALGPFLNRKFGIPVFINNDGSLFAYGESMVGALPWVNSKLEAAGSERRFHNLIGVTLGTGFGCGAVIDGTLLVGDNSCGGDIWCFRNSRYPDCIVEESVSIRAACRVYKELSGCNESLSPKDIYEIAKGLRPGDKAAAIGCFEEMGRCAGDVLAEASTIVDGIIVIGGGLAGASEFIIPAIVDEMHTNLRSFSGESFCRMQTDVLNLDDPASLERFVSNKGREIKVYGSDDTVIYNADKQIGIVTSTMGASKAISVGAYVFALDQITKNNLSI